MLGEIPSILAHISLVCVISVMFAWAFGNRHARWPAIAIALVACCISSQRIFRTEPICSFAASLIATDRCYRYFKAAPGQKLLHSISSYLALAAILAMVFSEFLIISKSRYFNAIGFAKIYLPGLAGMLFGRWAAYLAERKLDLCLIIGMISFASLFTFFLPEQFTDVDIFYYQYEIAPLVFNFTAAYFCSYLIFYSIIRRSTHSHDDDQANSLANNPMHVSGGRRAI